MHTSRLTSTFFSARRRDPVARLVDTTAGSSCGVMPTATARENSTASMTGRPRATLTTKIVTLSTPPTLANSPEKRVSPSWNSVWGWCSPSPTAIRPNWVEAPVATTTASAAPSWTTVPMNRHDDSSASGAPLATGSADFSAGTDSPVRIDSSHSRLLAASSRTSAGTIEPTPRCTMSPGTRCVTSTLTDSPSRVVATSWRISECIASAARSARYSLTNPRPTDAATITPMMTASSPSPTTADTAAAASSSHSNGLCSWRDSTDHALAWCERTAFGPNSSDRAATSAVVSPDGRDPTASSTWSGASAAAASIDGTEAASIEGAVTVTPKYAPPPLE